MGDFNGDGRCDIMQLFASGAGLYRAESPGTFGAPQVLRLPLVKDPRVVICGDYDADGQLDLIVAGGNGLALLSRDPDGKWDTATPISGELAYHGNANQTSIAGGCACDINNDGRQGVALFYPGRNPFLFFNRGFACFGLARELELTGNGNPAGDALDPFAAPAKPRPKAAGALQAGQAAGVVMDLNGEGVQDLLGVDQRGGVWALFGNADERANLAIALSPAYRGPVTVAVYEGRRRTGLHVVRPGVPTFVGGSGSGPLRLEWRASDGRKKQLDIEMQGRTRVELPN